MARFITQADMEAIFSVTDVLGLSREAIKVPLQPKGEGSVERLASGTLRIVVPDGPLDPWLPALRSRIEQLIG